MYGTFGIVGCLVLVSGVSYVHLFEDRIRMIYVYTNYSIQSRINGKRNLQESIVELCKLA